MKVPNMAQAAAEFLFDQVAMTHRFVVRIDKDDYDLGSWTKVSGLQVTWGKHFHRPGESNDLAGVPGEPSYTEIELARAACSDSATVRKWLVETSRRFEPLSGAIHMLDFVGTPIITWELKQFFPTSWAITGFESTSAKPAIEVLKIAHTGFLDDESGAQQ